MRRLLFLGLLLIPVHANAVKVFFTEWESKHWAESKFCAVGAFEDRADVRVELCAKRLGTQVKSLWFDVGRKSFLTPSKALVGLPDLSVEDVLISIQPCGASISMISGQPLKSPVPNCYTILIPTKKDAQKFVTIEFEDQRFVSVRTPALEEVGQ